MIQFKCVKVTALVEVWCILTQVTGPYHFICTNVTKCLSFTLKILLNPLRALCSMNE